VDRQLERELAPRLRASLRWPAREREYPGWDIQYTGPEGEVVAIEVKGTTAKGFATVDVTANEWTAAQAKRGRYWLFLVAQCASAAPVIGRLQDPVARMKAGAVTVEPAAWRITLGG